MDLAGVRADAPARAVLGQEMARATLVALEASGSQVPLGSAPPEVLEETVLGRDLRETSIFIQFFRSHGVTLGKLFPLPAHHLPHPENETSESASFTDPS